MSQPLAPQVLPGQDVAEVISSREQLAAALADLNNDVESMVSSDGFEIEVGCCSFRESALTQEAKRKQMGKMLTLIMVPIIALLSVSFYFMADNINNKIESAQVRGAVELSTELGQLIHLIQKERDMSVLYLSSIGPETKTFLTARYQETDEALEDLSEWPVDLDKLKRTFFVSKRALRRHLNSHRNELTSDDTMFYEVEFYSDIIIVLIRWIYDSIRESRFGVVWRSLVAYQKIVSAKEELGVERALGSFYFSKGSFEEEEAYHLYNEKRTLYKIRIKSALLYAPFLLNQSSDTGTDKSVLEGQQLMSAILRLDDNLVSPLAMFRQMIKERRASAPSLLKATYYYDNMTNLIGEHLEVQRAVSNNILALLDARSESMTVGVAASGVIIAVVLSMCPMLVRTIQRLTGSIQNYAMTLAAKTKELNREKKRTDSLLYQMLPKPVAEKLKMKCDVEAEFFKEVSIFFSDMLGFSHLIKTSSPMEVVSVLNQIYTLFDKRIECYDVYKVETIGDSYMLASGLPQRNGSRHVCEIANIALDLLQTCANQEIQQMPSGRIRLRIGIHSGQCVAGVVGLKLPRYCLFGDSVNTASRMETTGLPNCIHISASTFRLLERSGRYITKKRGVIEVKGKGTMTTYFLLSQRHTSEGSGASDTSYKNSNRGTKKPYVQNEDQINESDVNSLSETCGTVAVGKRTKIYHESLSDTIEFENIQKANPEVPDSEVEEVVAPTTGTTAAPPSLPEPVASYSGSSYKKASDGAAPPSYTEFEAELEASRNGSPPIFKVVEGYHY